MGWEVDISLPKDVDWKEVMALAYEQGVNAIVVDGIEILKNNSSDVFSSPKEKQLLLETIGRLRMVELNYLHHKSALNKISGLLAKNTIPFLLMKGFDCGRNYPIPKHRACGDIDIYPGKKFNESEELFKSKGFWEGRYYYRHSVYVVDGITIENHRVLGDLRGPRRQTQEFECLLQLEAEKSIESGDDVVIDGNTFPGAKYPSANFNALFLPWHVSAHLAFERVTLRHLLDWALFLVHEGDKIDVNMFRNAKKKYTFGYSRITDILTSLSMKYLKMPAGNIPMEILEDAVNVDDKLGDRVLDYMFTGQSREIFQNVWRFRWNNIKNIWRNRWKYEEIYNMSVVGFLYQKAIGVFFKVGE